MDEVKRLKHCESSHKITSMLNSSIGALVIRQCFLYGNLKVDDLKREFAKKEGEPLTLSYKINVKRNEHDHIVYRHDHNHGHGLQVLVLNVLWSVTCGRKLHPQQQEFQVVIIKIILIRIVI